MTKKSEPTKSENLQGRSWEIEARIVDSFVEFGNYQNRSPRDSAFITFFYIHKTLTQSQLRDLAHRYFNARKLRGFSSGSISNFLNDMEGKKLITKRREEGKNFFQYQILGSIKQLSFSQLGSLLFNKSSLEELKRRIKAELVAIKSNSPDYENIESFLNELTKLIPLYEKVFAYFSKESPLPPIPVEIMEKRVAGFFETIPDCTPTQEQIAKRGKEVSPVMLRVENLITNYFITRDQLLRIRGEVTSRVLSQFQIHRELTQERIRQLTGLSMGAVSQALHTLLDQDVIRITTAGDRSIHYQLQGLVQAFQSFTKTIFEKLVQWPVELEKMQNELLANEANFQGDADYLNVRDFLRDLIDFFQISLRFAEYWKTFSI